MQHVTLTANWAVAETPSEQAFWEREERNGGVIVRRSTNHHISWGSSGFCTTDRAAFDMIQSLPAPKGCLHYPADMAAALLEHGISSTIYGYSGTIYENGQPAGRWR